jgi:hypothetical protein
VYVNALDYGIDVCPKDVIVVVVEKYISVLWKHVLLDDGICDDDSIVIVLILIGTIQFSFIKL